MAMLEISNLSVSYGHVEALKNVSVSAEAGEIYSIIGSNGAGKTSLLRTISGLVKPLAGTITFLGKPLTNKPHEVVERGVIHVPEGRKTFSGLTVEDNLLVGGYRFRSKTLDEDLQKQYQRFPILYERRNQYAGTLSGGEQQMLAIARGLMGKPELMLLDEPSLGLAPLIVNQIYELILKIRESGITIFLVEQNAKKALSIADKACVLENGVITMSGKAGELLTSDEVKRAYLGA